jgi:hypothetical protein
MKLHYFFQSLKGKIDVLAEILAGNLHTDYMGECTAFSTLYIGICGMKVHEFLPVFSGRESSKDSCSGTCTYTRASCDKF